jgi:hypothetical protein
MAGPIPEILEQPVIPLPLHGVNPRNLMGKPAWDALRKTIYARHGHRCAACGVPSRQAMILPRLEAHERFEIDWPRREMHLIGMEPLCHACHAFVHGGLMEIRILRGDLSREDARRILAHGISVLTGIGGTIPQAAAKLAREFGVSHRLAMAKPPPPSPWRGWAMVWNGVRHPSPYPDEASWRRAMRAAD